MKNIGLIFGGLLLLLAQLTPPPAGMSDEAWQTAGVGMLMAVWWATEAIPVPVTSLLPIILFPIMGLAGVREATAPYAHPVIYLLMGGFIIATAIERWDLHRRLALNVLNLVGDQPGAIIAGFMGATAFLSMWISNTATTIMMVPIALSIGHELFEDRHKSKSFTICLMLGIAYSASIGGLGTLVGTPPNAMVAAFMSETYNVEIGFLQWMAFGLPIVLLLIPLTWFILTRLLLDSYSRTEKSSGSLVSDELARMGSISAPQKRMAVAFALVALAWVTRPFVQQLVGFSALNDTTIAVGGAVMMFLVPAGDKRDKNIKLLNWDSAQKIPWGVLILFGGGLSLASMVSKSGLAAWLGDSLSILTTLHLLIFTFSLVTLVIFLTELTSNTATTATLLPVIAATATSASLDPMLLAAPMAIAASCAFMLPVATAPNAIVYASREVSISQMSRAGFRVNVVGIFLISTLSYFLVPILFL